MRNLIISILVWLSFIGCSDKDGLLSPAEMKEDIRFYFHMIRDIHPDPYQRYDSLTFVRLEAAMIESCSEPMAREDFGFRLMKTRKFLDGHVGVFDFFSPPGRYHFPTVEFQGDLMLLGNDTLLAVRDSFASYTALDVDSKSTMTYTGVLKTADGTRDTLICVDTRRVKKNPIYTQAYSSKFYPEDSIAVLYYNSCMIYGEEDVKHYEGYVDAFFDELKSKKIKTLFIDVTHNGGGSDGNNSVIINHLKADAFTSKVRMTGKRAGIEEYLKSDLVKKFFNENETTKNYWLETFGNPIMEKGVAVLEESAPARESGYEGNVFVIMGNRTYSAGADFCLSIKAFKAATLVGEKAGQYYPICGNAIRGTLPNSKVMYQIPSTEAFYEPETLFEDGYICPDILYPLKEEMGVEDYKGILELENSKGI